jgi:transposase
MSNHIESTRRPASEHDAATAAANGVGHDVITGVGRRRRWSDDDKARIARESRESGASVPEVARRYGLSVGQLYKWRQTERAPSDGSAEAGARTRPVRQERDGSALVEARPAFAPVVMAMPAIPPHPTASESGLMEIVIGDVMVRVNGGADIDVERLAAVLSAVRGSS